MHDSAIVIPARNEEDALAVLLPRLCATHRVVVVDNNSTDHTAQVAEQAGAEVLFAQHTGYGEAVLTALDALSAAPPTFVVILDADVTAEVDHLNTLLAPLRAGQADLCLAIRDTTGHPGALTPPQRLGNAMALRWLKLKTGTTFGDLGPFRAFRWDVLPQLALTDRTWAFNIQMQHHAAARGLRIEELLIPHAPRQHGASKISGNVLGTARAAYIILRYMFRASNPE